MEIRNGKKLTRRKGEKREKGEEKKSGEREEIRNAEIEAWKKDREVKNSYLREQAKTKLGANATAAPISWLWCAKSLSVLQ